MLGSGWRGKKLNGSDPFFDIAEDFDLIVSSFHKQYGIRLLHEPLPWGEFCMLLEGIMADPPLGQTVSIRAETDTEIIKCFNSEQMRIHNDWKNKRAAEMKADDTAYLEAMNSFSAFFRSMAGGDA